MSPLLLPYTLITASVLAVMAFVLALRVGRTLFIMNVDIGAGRDGAPAPELMGRIRAQINFVEYVPLLLILMGLLEAGGANRHFLIGFGGLLILFRLMHAAGAIVMTRSFNRVVGEAGSGILLIVGAAYGLWLANGAF